MAKVVKIYRRDILRGNRLIFMVVSMQLSRKFCISRIKNVYVYVTDVQDRSPTESQDNLSLYIPILSVEAKVQGKLITLKIEKPLFPSMLV